jgi:cobalt transporter subunit CbtA
LTAGALAGFIAGLALTCIQYAQVIPLIREAERYETAAAALPGDSREHAAHDEAAWAPEGGVERAAYTAVANIAMAAGFGWLLAAGMGLRQRVTPAQGALWGLAGYGAFFVAPSLGLPPEIPGTEAADLMARQVWWLGTALASVAGLGLLAWARSPWAKGLGLALLVAPHAIGAPSIGGYAGIAPEQLSRRFIAATALANGVLWLLLGVTTAWATRLKA